MTDTFVCNSVQVWKGSGVKKAGLRYFKENTRNKVVLIYC